MVWFSSKTSPGDVKYWMKVNFDCLSILANICLVDDKWQPAVLTVRHPQTNLHQSALQSVTPPSSGVILSAPVDVPQTSPRIEFLFSPSWLATQNEGYLCFSQPENTHHRNLLFGFLMASFCSLVSLRIFPSIQQQCYALSFDSRGHGKVHFFSSLPSVA